MAAELIEPGFRRRQYERPPVAEAVARLQWREAVPWNITTPGLLYERMRDAYPAEPKLQNQLEAEFGQEDGNEAPNVQLRASRQRLVLGTDDGTRLLLVGAN